MGINVVAVDNSSSGCHRWSGTVALRVVRGGGLVECGEKGESIGE